MKQENMIDLLLKLISIPSYRGYQYGVRELAEFLRNFFMNYGIESYLHDLGHHQLNLIASIGKGENTILLASHLDTVEIQGMTVPAFGKRDKDIIYGRGACDMKGGIAAMVSALINLSSEKLKNKIVFLADAGEEQQSIGADYFLKSKYSHYDYVVVGEPTNLKPVVTHKGVMWIQVIFKGKTAHASFPERGNNAIVSANLFIQHLIKELIPKLSKKKDHFLGSPTLNIGEIHGGSGVNVVAAECNVNIDRRYLPDEEREEVFEEIKEIAHRIAHKTKTRVTVKEMKETSTPRRISFKMPADHEFIKTVTKILKEMNLSGIPSSVPFWTEASLFTQNNTVPGIVIGPGDPSLAHSPNEHVSVEEVIKASEIYRTLCLYL
jgi:succinyl-diaminopimelate desuccinylase